MAELHFTSWLRNLVPDGPISVTGATVGAALAQLFGERPHLRSYVLDDQGRLRKHICIFANGIRLERERALAEPIAADCKLHVMQALSGG